jgi:hypothetical protein
MSCQFFPLGGVSLPSAHIPSPHNSHKILINNHIPSNYLRVVRNLNSRFTLSTSNSFSYCRFKELSGKWTYCLKIRSNGQHVILPADGAHSYWTIEKRRHGSLTFGVCVDMMMELTTRNRRNQGFGNLTRQINRVLSSASDRVTYVTWYGNYDDYQTLDICTVYRRLEIVSRRPSYDSIRSLSASRRIFTGWT